jgi:ribosomal protein S18 acetylase RimI-like enzyme
MSAGPTAWRPAALTDIAGLAGLFQAIELEAPIGLETETAEIRARLTRPQLDLGADTLTGVDATGALLAYAEAADMGVGGGRFRVRLTCAVHPSADSDLLPASLDWLTRRARHMRAERSPDLPGVVAVRCAAVDETRRTALTAAGFAVDHWHNEMIRGVAQPVPAPPPPSGTVVIPYTAQYCEAVRLTHNDAYTDDPHGVVFDTQDWPRQATGLASFRPDASFLVLAEPTAGQDVAAFVLSLEHHDTTGARIGTLQSVGTHQRWRRHGLATIVISHTLAAYQQAGFTAARLQVCSHNTSAVQLYTKLGFTTSDRSYAILQAPSDPDAAEA